jgi:hypothetical protein
MAISSSAEKWHCPQLTQCFRDISTLLSPSMLQYNIYSCCLCVLSSLLVYLGIQTIPPRHHPFVVQLQGITRDPAWAAAASLREANLEAALSSQTGTSDRFVHYPSVHWHRGHLTLHHSSLHKTRVFYTAYHSIEENWPSA